RRRAPHPAVPRVGVPPSAGHLPGTGPPHPRHRHLLRRRRRHRNALGPGRPHRRRREPRRHPVAPHQPPRRTPDPEGTPVSLIDHARTAATAWKDEADRTGDPHLDHEDAFIAGAQWFAGLADTPPATIDAVTATIERLLNSQRAYG